MALGAPALREGETADTALGGAVGVIQAKRGYRFSLDAVLLARFAAEQPAHRVLDLGCGSGVGGLCLLALCGAERVVGADIQEAQVDRAQRSARWNGLEERAEFRVGDLRKIGDWLPPGSVSSVLCNPPYRPVASGRISPDPSTASARHEVTATLQDIAAAARHALSRGGTLHLVYPASRLTNLVCGCRGQKLEPKVLRLTHPREDAPASFAFLRCVKGAKEGLEIRPPLILHGEGERYSPEALRLLGPP